MGVAPYERIAPIQSPTDKHNFIQRASEEIRKSDNKRKYSAASPCKSDKTDIKGIQLVIQELQNGLTVVRKFSNINTITSSLINDNTEPGRTVKKIIGIATLDIAGYTKNIIGRARGWVLREIHNGAKKVLPFLFPSEQPEFNKKLNDGINGISCAFAKIVRGLTQTVGNLLLGLIDKYINGPLCFVEDFVNGLLENILEPLKDAINGINSLLGSAFNAIENLGNSLFNILDFVMGIESFFKCDDDKKCPTEHEISRGGNGSGNSTDPSTGNTNSTTLPSNKNASDIRTSKKSVTIVTS